MKKAPGRVLNSRTQIHFLLGCKLDLPEADSSSTSEMPMGLPS